MDCSMPGLPVHHQLPELLKLMSIESVMPSNHLILCHPLLLLPSILSGIRVFSNESVFCIRWPKYWSFSFSISPSNEHPGLISFRMDWLDLLAVQGTLKSVLQHHSSKASILQHSAFFMLQLSHLYMTTQEKTLYMDITRWSMQKADWLYSLQPKIEKLYTVSKNKGADCGSDHELLIAKFRLKFKKVGKTTRPFRDDLNQIPYNYTVEVKNSSYYVGVKKFQDHINLKNLE